MFKHNFISLIQLPSRLILIILEKNGFQSLRQRSDLKHQKGREANECFFASLLFIQPSGSMLSALPKPTSLELHKHSVR